MWCLPVCVSCSKHVISIFHVIHCYSYYFSFAVANMWFLPVLCSLLPIFGFCRLVVHVLNMWFLPVCGSFFQYVVFAGLWFLFPICGLCRFVVHVANICL